MAITIKTCPKCDERSGSEGDPSSCGAEEPGGANSGRNTLNGLVQRGWNSKPVLLSAIMAGFILGYFVGREHLKYEIRSTFEVAGKSVTKKPGWSGRTSEASMPAKDKANLSLLVPTMERKGFQEGKYGDDEVTFTLDIENRTGRDVRAFDGVLVVTDLLGNDIISSKLAVNDPVAAARTLKWRGSLNYNQFMDSHQRFRAAERENIKLAFFVNKILFANGETKQYDE